MRLGNVQARSLLPRILHLLSFDNHGGIVGALADSAAGYAALSLLAPGLEVVTVEYKISFLAPAFGEYLVGRGEVLRAGRTLQFCSADIFAVQDGVEKAVAQMTTTMMAVPDPKTKT